jgi:hypothetical protein
MSAISPVRREAAPPAGSRAHRSRLQACARLGSSRRPALRARAGRGRRPRAARSPLPPEGRLEGLRFHDLRHTAATLAVVAGATTKELMARMGHSTPDMAIRYQHIMEGRDAIIAAGLDRLIQAGDGAKPSGTDVARRERKRGTRSTKRPSDQRREGVPSAGFEPAAYCSGGSRSLP